MDRRTGGLVRWQGDARRSGGAWAVVVVTAGLLALALIAVGAAGWLHWGTLLLLVPVAVLAAVFGAGLIALARRGLAWLAG